MRSRGSFYKKILSNVPFHCTATHCPKHLEVVSTGELRQRMHTPFSNNYKPSGCAQFRTFIWGLAKEACSPEDFDSAPLLGVILPNPDPTGAQGAAEGFGFGRDVIFESLIMNPDVPKPLRVAVFYLTRGYNFKSVAQGELINMPITKPVIANCQPYLEAEMDKIRPQSLLLCSYEVANTFTANSLDALPDMRRRKGVRVKVGSHHYPAQITYNPHFTSIVPPMQACLREDVGKLFTPPLELARGSTQLITKLDEVMEFFDYLENYKDYVALDYETANLNRKAPNRLGTIQFATSPSGGVVIPYQHYQTPFDTYELKVIAKRMARLFAKPRTPEQRIAIAGWIIHNAKFENTVSKNQFGTFIRSAPIFDTQAGAFLLDETRSERKADIPRKGGIYSLKQLSRDKLGWEGYDKGALTAREEGTLIDLPLIELADYGSMDVWVTYALFEKQREEAAEQGYLKQYMRLSRLFYGPATQLISHIEMSGFKARLKYVRQLAAKKGPIERRLEEIEGDVRQLPAYQKANHLIAKKKNGGNVKGVMGTVPWVLDITKPDHQRLIFLDVMNLDPVSWSDKSGKPSIDDEFYEAYSEEHKEVRLFAQHAELRKMRDSFITKTLERIDPEYGDPDCRIDQRIRPDIHYSRLVTGRWAMVKPNMGQIPKAEEADGASDTDLLVRKAVKDIFTVEPGCGLIQIDYKVNEVRWAGILSGDVNLAKIFNEAAVMVTEARALEDEILLKKADLYEDVHKGTASEMFKKIREEVTKKERQIAKAITFGLLFQQGAPALAEAVGIEIDEAEAHIATFFSRMREVDLWIKRMKLMAAQYGYVESPDGRRRRFWGFDLPDSCPNKRKHMARNERQAVNSPIQGIASGAAMVGGAFSLLEYIQDNNKPWIIQNVVHDSCLLQTPLEDMEEAILIAEPLFVGEAMRRMEEMGVTFNLPLAIDVEAGIPLWGSLTKWKGTKTHAKQIVQITRDYWKTQ